MRVSRSGDAALHRRFRPAGIGTLSCALRPHALGSKPNGLHHSSEASWYSKATHRCAQTGLERHRDRRDLHDPVRLRIETRRLDIDDVDMGAQSSFSS